MFNVYARLTTSRNMSLIQEVDFMFINSLAKKFEGQLLNHGNLQPQHRLHENYGIAYIKSICTKSGLGYTESCSFHPKINFLQGYSAGPVQTA